MASYTAKLVGVSALMALGCAPRAAGSGGDFVCRAGLDIGTLNAGEWHGLWIRREIPAGIGATAEHTTRVALSYDA